MNTRKNTLWRPIDGAAEQLEVSRATLYRWIKLKRIKKLMRDGFVFVDLYEVEEVIRAPRKSRGRLLAVQKVRAENKRQDQRRIKVPPSLLSIVLDTQRKIGRIADKRAFHGPELDIVLDRVDVLRAYIVSLKPLSR